MPRASAQIAKKTVKKTVKKSNGKKSGKSTKASAVTPSLAERTRAINTPKEPTCLYCHEDYDPKDPGIKDLKNNPGYCSVECGYLHSKKAPGKPQDAQKDPEGKIVPKALSKALLEPAKGSYVPSKLQGKAVQLPAAKSESPVQVIDIVSGEILDSHPGELILKDDVEGYYSHSTIKSLASCSAAVYFRKTGVKMVPAYALERGSAAHAALECFQKTHDSKKAMAVFEENWKLLVLDNADKMKPSDQQKIRLGYLETQRMVEEFIIENGDVIKGKNLSAAEVEFSIIVNIGMGGGHFKRRIFGKMDWIKWSADRKHYTILDYKTSGQAPPDNELDRDTQFAIYQLAGTELYGFPPDKMVFYYLKGQHIHGGKFSKEHPRPTTAEGMAKCLQFAFDIPIKSDKEIQAMIDTYYGPVILAHEIGLITKNLSDARKCVSMCGYKDHCDKTTSLPLPRFARYA